MAENEGGNAPSFEPSVTGAEVVVNPAGGSEGTPTTAPEVVVPNAEGNEQQPAAPLPAASTPENGGESQEQPKDDGKGETPSTQPDEFKEIIEGWKEDRMALTVSEKENQTLRDENSQLKLKLSRYENEGEGEVDEYAGLTREERDRKVIEKHEAEKKAAMERERNEVAKEIAFHERTNREFRENKAEILKIADSFNASNIEQAIKIWKAQQIVAERSKKAAEAELKRKKDATGVTPGGSGTGAPAIAGYDPKRDAGKSIREIYAEGGIS